MASFTRRGSSCIERVAAFARLEKRVGVLGGAADHRRVGRQRAVAVGLDAVLVDQRAQVVVTEQGDFGNLMGRPEPIEEMQERHPRAQRHHLGNHRRVLRLLHRSARQHREAGLAAGHHVRMIAENAQRVRRQRAGRDVQAEGNQFARDLIHVGDHQQQPLRGRERCAQRTRQQRTVQRPGRPAFGLHFHHTGNRAPQVVLARRRPFVRKLRHRRRTA